MGKAFIQCTPIKVLGQGWKVYFQTDGQFESAAAKAGLKGAWAYCDARRRCMYFNCEANYYTLGVVRHELTHAYVHELMGHDVGFDRDQFEEFVCTLMEEKVLQLLKTAKPLMALLQKHAKRLKAKKSSEDLHDD